MEDKERIINSFQLIDPLLQFLTKATGQTVVNIHSLQSIIPKDKRQVIKDIPPLCNRGVLYVEGVEDGNEDVFNSIADQKNVDKNNNDHDDSPTKKKIMIGFPQPIIINQGGSVHVNEANQKPRSNIAGAGLHGSTKAAAKRRLAALKRSFKSTKSKTKSSGPNNSDSTPQKNGSADNSEITPDQNSDSHRSAQPQSVSRGLDPALMSGGMVHHEKYMEYSVKEQHGKMKEGHTNTSDSSKGVDNGAHKALTSLHNLFKQNSVTKETSKEGQSIGNNPKGASFLSNGNDDSFILPKQVAYAGSQPARPLRNKFLSKEVAEMIPDALRSSMGLQLTEDDANGISRQQLYLHQALAIDSAIKSIHTLVCTGTGSGKSLCFLLPTLATVLNNDIGDDNNENCLISSSSPKGSSALIMFPTKALAQDQFSKINALIKMHPQLEKHIRPGIIDGDVHVSDRAAIADRCNIIMSNPDTLSAAILPGSKGVYKSLLAKLQYIVIDELHSYEGAFGAHVSLVLSRLYRVCKVANLTAEVSCERKLVFIGCSATIGHPEEHFRLICPIPAEDKVTVVTAADDGSRCAAKHFFVWNPSLLDSNGNCIGRVTVPPRKQQSKLPNAETSSFNSNNRRRKRKRGFQRGTKIITSVNRGDFSDVTQDDVSKQEDGLGLIKRTHAADETARILAHLVKMRIRCIAFCKTRGLAEWVYEKCVGILKSSTEKMASLVEIYRGGYTASIRRGIESRLFRNELFGVVGTSALELGVDIGGIDVTLHCGYPGSINSLLQQAGRAGRGSTASRESYSIMVCFSSPSEQHIWKHPRGLLGRGLSAPPAVPLTSSIVCGHMLCAAEEFPLAGGISVTSILCKGVPEKDKSTLCDYDLFGSEEVYTEALENILERGQIRSEKINRGTNVECEIYSLHPSIQKPSLNINLRSIEPISYSIVDLSHPRQCELGMNSICDEAVLDHIPYSRVFYHCFPGAVIIHRGRRYKIHSMSSPPAFANPTAGYRCNSCNLGAFAKPTNVQYSTNALSITLITVVKQLQRVELTSSSLNENINDKHLPAHFEPELNSGCLAGNGVVTVKRTVHGYKKLSLVNRIELSRSEITLPPMEYDTNALWIDTEASVLAELLPDYDKGVHALSHSIVAVAPLFVPCNSSDIDCDHSHYGCTRVLLFDVRAGGAGTCALLWRHFFHPDGVLKAAIDLLSECPLECDQVGHYKGGCPGCIQAVPCINFQQDLSRSAGLLIARRMLGRIEKTALYQQNCEVIKQNSNANSPDKMKAGASYDGDNTSPSVSTPRNNLRQKKLDRAADLVSARKRNIVVGRESWPTDHASSRFNTAVEDIENEANEIEPFSPKGGFI